MGARRGNERQARENGTGPETETEALRQSKASVALSHGDTARNGKPKATAPGRPEARLLGDAGQREGNPALAFGGQESVCRLCSALVPSLTLSQTKLP